METLIQELRFALRVLGRQRSFASIVVLTLALGIGVNTLVFCFADLMAFRPLPFQDMDRVASLWLRHPERGDERIAVSDGDFADWRSRATSFEEISARTYTSHNLTGISEPTRVQAVRATASLFRVWGLRAVRGRTFLDEEDQPGAPRVALVSHGFWQRRLGADPAVIGRVVRLDGQPHEIVGVLTPEIEIGGLSRIEVWTPLGPDADPTERERRRLRVDGRLRPGVSLEQVAAEMRTLVAGLADEHPNTNAGYAVEVMPLRKSLMGQGTYLTMALLSLAVIFVLAIACGNVASLTLARNAARERETALRAALGAGRLRVVRQLLTEGAVLALAGGALGVGLAWGGLRLLRASTYDPVFRFVEINPRVLIFSVTISLLTPLLFGLLPALQAVRLDLTSALREVGTRSATGARGGRGRRGLVVAQLSLALMLLVVAGLSMRTALHLQTRDLGFEPRDLATMRIDLPAASYPDGEPVRVFVETLLERLAASPGAAAVAAASSLPVIDAAAGVALAIEGQPPATPGAAPWAARSVVTPDYFGTFGIPLLRGRAFAHTDARETLPVAIVSQAFAERHLGDGEPLGGRIRLGSPDQQPPWLTVVGVAEDVQNPDYGEPPLPQAYVPFAQQPERSVWLLVRTPQTAAALAAARNEVARLDPDQALWSATTFEQLLREELNWSRVFTAMLTAFGLVALLLAAIGLYGVVSYAVSQRTREIGVRVALGADRRDVLVLVLRQGAALVALGLTLGLLGGVGLARAMRSMLAGLTPTDPATFAAVVVTLTAVALVATLLPALRAARVDPSEALRAG